MDALLADLKVDDGMGSHLTLLRHQKLEGERLKIYTTAFPELSSGDVMACTYANDAGERLEHTVHVVGGRCVS